MLFIHFQQNVFMGIFPFMMIAYVHMPMLFLTASFLVRWSVHSFVHMCTWRKPQVNLHWIWVRRLLCFTPDSLLGRGCTLKKIRIKVPRGWKFLSVWYFYIPSVYISAWHSVGAQYILNWMNRYMNKHTKIEGIIVSDFSCSWQCSNEASHLSGMLWARFFKFE